METQISARECLKKKLIEYGFEEEFIERVMKEVDVDEDCSIVEEIMVAKWIDGYVQGQKEMLKEMFSDLTNLTGK